MRKILFIIGLFIVLGLAVRQFRAPTSGTLISEGNAPTPLAHNVKTSPPSPTTVTYNKQKFQRGTSPNATIEARNEPSHVVEFVVRDGIAIAFNDIILGTPDEETLASGHYEFPAPQYWDRPEIPFAINADVEHPDQIQLALRHIEDKTKLRFVPYDSQPDALLFQKGPEHCESALGRTGGLQPIRLAAHCGWNEVIHEILHALGFIHEQSRLDRDVFVEVQWDNIAEKFWPQFQKLTEGFQGPAKGAPFDYHSIMMYDPTTFTKQRGTIALKTTTSTSIQPSHAGLSPEDIRRIKVLFRLD